MFNFEFIKYNPKVLDIKSNTQYLINALDNSRASFTILPYYPLTNNSFGNYLDNNLLYTELENAISEICFKTKYRGAFIITIPYIFNNSKTSLGVLINNKKIVAILNNDFLEQDIFFLSKKYLIKDIFSISKNITISFSLNKIVNNKANLLLYYSDIKNKPEDHLRSSLIGLEHVLEKGIIMVNSGYSSINEYRTPFYGYATSDEIITNNNFLIDNDIYQKLYPRNNNSEFIKLNEYIGPLKKNPFDTNYQMLIDLLATMLNYKLQSLNSVNTVIGLSGGLDSVLAYLLLNYTYQKYNLDQKQIYSYFLKTRFSSSASINTFNTLVNFFNTSSKIYDIDSDFENIKKNYQLEKSITKENIQARLRTLILTSMANDHNAILIGTSDLSEIALGFMTYGGDQISMYSLQGGLPKTIIKELVLYFTKIYPPLAECLTNVYKRPISPELEANQDSEKILGKYEYNDFILYYLLKYNFNSQKITKFLSTTFNLDIDIAENYVNNFIKRFNKNQFKLKLIAEGPNPYNLVLNYVASMPSDHEQK